MQADNTIRRRLMGLALAIGLAASTGVASAQEAPPTADPVPEVSPEPNPFRHVVFGVTLEGYYQWNANEPYDRITPAARLRHARQHVRAPADGDRHRERARRRRRPPLRRTRRPAVRPGHGRRCRAVRPNEPRPDVYRNVWQAYGTYVFPVGRGLQTDFGKFASNLGYETNYAKDNHHFSRALLFNFLPYYHSGLRVSLPVTRPA